MMKNYPIFMRPMLGALAATAAASSIAATLGGQVQGGGAPIAGSTVTLFAAGTGAAAGADEKRRRRPLYADGACCPCRLQPLPGRPGRAADRQQGRRQQPGHRPDDGARQQAAGQGHDQRNDHRRLGVDAQPVHQRHDDPGAAAATEDRRRQRAELRRSRHRWLGRHDPGPAQQRPDADDGQFRHAGQCAVRLRDAGEGRCLRFPVRRRQGADRRNTRRHAERGSGDRQGAVVSAAAGIRAARTVLSVPQGKTMRPVPFMPYLQFLRPVPGCCR
jgi:hypothetical protein